MAGLTESRRSLSASCAFLTAGGSTPDRRGGAWFKTTIARLPRRRMTASVRTSAAKSRRVGRTTSSSKSASTIAWEKSSSLPAAVSITRASTPSRRDDICSDRRAGPEASTTLGSAWRRAFSTSTNDRCGSEVRQQGFQPATVGGNPKIDCDGGLARAALSRNDRNRSHQTRPSDRPPVAMNPGVNCSSRPF